jgi:hypothetical protein
VDNLAEAKLQVCDFGLSAALRNISSRRPSETVYG